MTSLLQNLRVAARMLAKTPGFTGSLGVVGCLAGLALFRALPGLFEANLYQVRVFDPLAVAGVPLLLLGVTLLAAYLPAHRATQVEPLVALRHE